MDAVVVLEWKFSPADYFGSSFEIKQNDYTITVADGKAEAKINSVAYEANSSIRSELNDVLESAFLGAQLSNNKIYNLLRPDLTRVEHADGRKDYFLEVEPAYIKITPHPVTLSKCDNDGNVIEDLETQRTKKYIDLIRKHCKDEVLKKLLKSRNASMNDSDNELTHLYEIYDALSRKFRGNKKADSREARSTLCKYQNLSQKKWDQKWRDFTDLCNNAPLKGGRHGGKHETLRDATDAELFEVRGTAKAIIDAYLQYLEKNWAQTHK
jgi:hypothetical protein